MTYFTNIGFHFLIITLAIIQIHCSHQKLSSPVYRIEDLDQGIKSDIMSGNYSDLIGEVEPKTLLSLNPGRIYSQSTSTYYILNLVYINESDSLVISSNDEIEIIFDQNSLKLKPYNVQYKPRETVSFYEIDPFDIVDISNANSVRVRIPNKNKIVEASFNQGNIHNFKIFAAKYILKSKFEPKLKEPQIDEKWGFISPGTGTGYELWLGKYFNMLTQENSGFRDYISLGAGFSSFDYEVLGIRQFWIENPDNPIDTVLVIRYWQDEFNEKNYPYIGLSYGISENTWIKNWSIEMGITVQYFFLPDWQDTPDSIYIEAKEAYFPIQEYSLGAGNLFDGFSAGIFLQVGGIWARVNTKKSWAAGIALPLPWW
jgi:hypothetical protein